MKGAPKLVLVLKGWIVVFVLVIIARPTEGNNNQHANERKLATNNPGFISIDCGVEDDYIDEGTGISYKSDRDFVDTGTNYEISSSYDDLQNPYIGRQLKNLRSFSQGTRNCYTLKPVQGKNNSYLIKAYFMYGNYDNKNQAPSFALYLGANRWATIQMDAASSPFLADIIHISSSDTIFVCLINTGNGVPFISALELRHLEYNSPYQIQSAGLIFLYRLDMGTSREMFVRYKDDVYDRLWYGTKWPVGNANYPSINTSSVIDVQSSKEGYELPATVLRTAVVPASGYSDLNFKFNLQYTRYYYVYLHFAEIEELAQSQKREFNIYWNGEEYLKGPITLDYLKPLSISLPNTSVTGEVYLNLTATKGSELPPILNALEIYGVLPLPLLPTEPEDVTAIMDIKQTYNINSNTWQGDPCVPINFSWNILTCSSSNTPRIISLNLSSSQLKGNIATSLSNLTAIQSLDLSCNELSGPIPNFFAQLPNLKILNLSGNKFTGSIPHALMEKSTNKSLELSLEDNPKFCRKVSSKKQPKKFPILIVAIIVLVPIIILGALAIFWRIKKKKHEGEKKMKQKMLIQELGGHLIKKGKVEKDGQTSHDVQFLSFESITAATNNFSTENKLGEGGFGPVYKGKLLNGQEIAIKRLSRSSGQGLMEFKNEALLIAKLQHTNLVRLLGFCIQEEEKILIYEYMPNKSLDFFLFDSTKRRLLTWKIRFNIIEGIAQGLVYLHKYSRLRVIHRDLKASNILLDDKMNPKISDFGLARIFGLNVSEEKTNRVIGTYGYMSPEYAINGVVSIKTDVFSFGVLLLEIVSGKKNNSHYQSDYPITLIGYAWKLWNEDRGLELIDPPLDESCPPNEALRCIHVGLLCVQDHATDRPTMLEVVSMLSNETVQLTLPKQPAFFINTVVEKSKVPEIQPESSSINNVTISALKAR